MNRSVLLGIAFLVLVLAGGTAAAYPQYQLSRDQTCTGCHLSPAGGGLLNENGFASAETLSQLGTAPEFMNGLLPSPVWLTLGGDLRSAMGFIASPEKVLAYFPMQLELAATAKFDAFSVHATVGYPGREAPPVLSREHYVQWQQHADENTGLYVRAGRFLPVFGLRYVEHPTYTRRYGGTPLWGESYGLHVAYIDPKFEIHGTGFIEDPIVDPVVHGNGGALYAEVRLTEKLLIGGEGMLNRTDDDRKIRGGVVGKYYIEAAKLLLAAEVQYVKQKIDGISAEDSPAQIVASVIGTYTVNDFVQIDLGIGTFDNDLNLQHNHRDAIDLNARYTLTSHFEMQLNARYEAFAFGKDFGAGDDGVSPDGGKSGGYALLQLHYRL